MRKFPALFAACFTLSILSAVLPAIGAQNEVQVSGFGKTSDGISIYRYVLNNRNGMEAVVISYGATLVSLKVPDRHGKVADVVLGYDSLDGYEQGKSFFGGSIGRYGNRIARGQFSLDGTVYHLPINDGLRVSHRVLP